MSDKWRKLFILLFLALLPAMPVVAGVHENIGFNRLKKELGRALPTGEGISVGQVESSMPAPEPTATTGQVLTWMPNTRDRFLRTYTIVDRSGAPAGAYSRHATAVARRFIGRGPNQGMVSEIDRYLVYSVTDWIGAGMLKSGTRYRPDSGPLRVVNHSWAADGRDSRILRRADWLTDREELIQVVGVRNRADQLNTTLLAAAFNVIVVGRSDGKHSTGVPAVDSLYAGGRTRPHIIAPLNSGSAAAPTVASATVLLLAASQNPELSTRSASFRNRNGLQIFDAGRSEVIRAVLMASADRDINPGGSNAGSYRDTAGHRTDNGLDTRFGAGQLDIHEAWHVLNAGEQDRLVESRGFDYEPGLVASDSGESESGTRRYLLPEVTSPARLTATLSWNLLFPVDNSTYFDASAVLHDLDLSVYEILDGQRRLVQISRSRIETTETIRTGVMPGRQYELVVARNDNSTIPQDYALAWSVNASRPRLD